MPRLVPSQRGPNWVVLGKRVIREEAPTVGFRTNGKDISFNKSALRLLGQPEAVEILFDAARGLVGFRRADKSANAYRVSPAGVVASVALIQTMKIDTSTNRRYPAEMLDGVLVIKPRDSESPRASLSVQ